jgi:ABC-type branched-subunit amino acid transport system substrate-binding protein
MKKIALMHMTNSSGQGFADEFIKAVKTYQGVEVVIEVTYDADVEVNFTNHVSQLLSSGCDGIVQAGNQTDNGLVMKEIGTRGFDGPKVIVSSGVDPQALEIAGKYAEGWASVADWSPETPREKGRNHNEKYKKYTGRDSTLVSVTSYDNLYIFKQACELAGAVDPVALQEKGFPKVNYEGAQNLYIPDELHRMATSTLQCVVENGVAKVVDIISR